MFHIKKLIAFSGVDGSGKSTQLKLLSNKLNIEGKKNQIIWSRGGYTPAFDFIKKLFRISKESSLNQAKHLENRKTQMNKSWIKKIWLVISILDLIFLYSVVFRYKGLMGYHILADRYIYDSLLDFNRNFPGENVSEWWLWRLLTLTAPKPRIQFLLLVSVEVSKTRSRLKNEPFPDSEDTLKWRYEKYCELCRNNDYHYIDCTKSIEQVHEVILSKI